MFGSEVAGTVRQCLSLERRRGPWSLVLNMKDSSKIAFGKNSQAKLEAGSVRLLSGTMQYEIAQGITRQVAVENDVLATRTGVASTTAGDTLVPAPVAPVTVTPAPLPPPSRRKP